MEGFESLDTLIAQCIDNSPHVHVLRRQASRLIHRMHAVRSGLVHRIDLIERGTGEITEDDMRDINTLERDVQTLADAIHSRLLVPIYEWPSCDEYSSIVKYFQKVYADIIKLNDSMNLQLPLPVIKEDWQDTIDAAIDWMDCLSDIESNVDSRTPDVLECINGQNPGAPRLLQICAEDIIEMHNVLDPAPKENRECIHAESDSDEEQQSTNVAQNEHVTHSSSVSCHLGVVRGAPVHLKIVTAEAVRGGRGGGGLLHLAYLSNNTAQSDYLQRVLAVCLEAEKLKTFSQEKVRTDELEGITTDSDTKPAAFGIDALATSLTCVNALVGSGESEEFSCFPHSIVLISQLAPFGSLREFMSHPPDDVLVDESTQLRKDKYNGGVISPLVKASIMLDVCSGLQALHAKGIAHGRLHYNNVLIFQGYRAKLCDFGLAHVLNPQSNRGGDVPGPDSKSVEAGGIGCEARWKAPEVSLRFKEMEGLLHTTAADVYSLGMVMFSVVTEGLKPFFNLPWEEAVINSLSRGERPAFPRKVPFRNTFKPVVAEDDGLVVRCWRNHPEERINLRDVEPVLKSILIDVMYENETRIREELECDINIAEMNADVKAKKLAAGENKAEKAKSILQKKEDDMNAKKLASEKRKLKAALDKARPKLTALEAENEVLRGEIEARKKESSRLRAELKASDKRLMGGKNYILRHRTWNDTFDIGELISRYGRKHEVPYLTKWCGPKHALKSFAFECGRPLEEHDEIDDSALLSLCAGSMYGRVSEPQVDTSMFFQFHINSGETSGTSSSGGKVHSSAVSSDVDNPLGGGPFRRASIKQFYNNDTLVRTTSRDSIGSIGRSTSLHGDGAEIWDWPASDVDGVSRKSKGKSASGDEFRPISRQNPQSAIHVDMTEELRNLDLDEDMYDIDVQTDEPETMFLTALRGDVVESVGMYRSQCFNVKFINEVAAAWQGQATINQEDLESWSSPCHLAAHLGHLSVLRNLIEVNGLPPDQPSDEYERTPLHLACRAGHLHIVRYLVERHKSDMERADHESLTPILVAAMCGHAAIVSYISKRLKHKSGKDFYADKELGGSLLHWACVCSTSTVYRRTMCTIDSRHLDTVYLALTDLKIPVDIRSSIDQSTPLHWACAVSPPTRTKLKVIEALVEKGADVNAEDDEGQTCLFYAAASGDIVLVRILVEKLNVVVGKKDIDGDTALKVATGECYAYLKSRSHGKRFSILY
mmetsp:Transcript_23865/g.35009  ORF Transcript_23865/g.35009 Transcript_23865/m.35009 type:complete len:1223 (+) Transcript_23865:81-3749(+)